MTALLVAILLFLPDSTGHADRVRDLAESSLAARFPAEASRLEVRVRRTGGTIGSGDLRLTWPAEGELPRGLVQVNVLEGSQKTGWALLYVAHFDSALTAVTRIERGDTLAGGSFAPAWIETTRMTSRPLHPAVFREMAGQGPLFSTQYLREGQILQRDDLRGALAAETGQAVDMIYRRGRIGLRLACKAREPGSVGETIRLLSPDTGVIYRARLTAPGQAEWVETLTSARSRNS